MGACDRLCGVAPGSGRWTSRARVRSHVPEGERVTSDGVICALGVPFAWKLRLVVVIPQNAVHPWGRGRIA